MRLFLGQFFLLCCFSSILAIPPLHLGIGAKVRALGGAYTASITGPASIYWNPAGIAHSHDELNNNETTHDNADVPGSAEPLNFNAELYSSLSFLSLQTEMIFVGTSLTSPIGTIGVGFLGAQIRDVDSTDALGIANATQKPQWFVGYLGYAYEFGSWRAGVNIMGLAEELGKVRLAGGGIDMGMQFVTSFFEIGFSLHNIGIIQNTTSASNYVPLDVIIRLSGAIRIFRTPIKIYVGANAVVTNIQNIRSNVGVSINIFRYTSLLVGLNGSNITGGLLFDFNYLTIGYAVDQNPLDKTVQHHIEFRGIL